MQLFIRRTVKAGKQKPSVLRKMSSLTSGQVLTGGKWDYRISEVLKGDGTHVSATFKAEILPKDGVMDTPQWAFIKTATPSNKNSRENLDRERQTYLLPSIASAACFRKLYDMVDDQMNIGNGAIGSISYAAFEWLDTTLADVKYQPDLRTYAIIQAVLKTALTSCTILADRQLVNTDYKPANILLSDIEADYVSAKVGDLGLVFPAGSRYSAQPHAMRAPEVWQGLPCTEASALWAVAAMLLCWIKPGILGTWASPMPLLHEPWCIAKLMRLFPTWTVPPIENDVRQRAFNLAKAFVDEPPPELEQISYLEDELGRMDVMPELKNVLRLMLVVSPTERPSPNQVLTSEEFLALEIRLAAIKDTAKSPSCT